MMSIRTDHPITERDPEFMAMHREIEEDVEAPLPIRQHINTLLDYDLLVARYLDRIPPAGWEGAEELGTLSEKDVAIVVAARFQELAIRFDMRRLAEVAAAGPIPLAILAAHAFSALHEGARMVLFCDVMDQRERETNMKVFP